jgi:hypothetical protein
MAELDAAAAFFFFCLPPPWPELLLSSSPSLRALFPCATHTADHERTLDTESRPFLEWPEPFLCAASTTRPMRGATTGGATTATRAPPARAATEDRRVDPTKDEESIAAAFLVSWLCEELCCVPLTRGGEEREKV